VGAAPTTFDARPAEGPTATRASTTPSVWIARLDVTRGLLPHVAPGPSLAGRLQIRAPISIGAGLLWLPDGSTPDQAFSFGMTAGFMGPCLDALRGERAGISLCWNLLAGEIHAVVADTRQADPATAAWFGTSGSVLATWRFADPVTAELGLEAIAPLGPYELHAKTCDITVFRQTALAAGASIGVGMSFH